MIQNGSVKGYQDMDISYTLVSNKEVTKKLAIILPGYAYTVQGPLLHFTSGVFLDRNFTILEVNYKYNNEAYKDFTRNELDAAVTYDTQVVVDHTLKDLTFDQFYIAGMSLGTVASGHLLNKPIFQPSNTKVIWFSPLLNNDDIYNFILNSNHENVCFIGDSDRGYNEERVAKIDGNIHVHTKIISNGNHTLEYDGDAYRSIEALNNIIKTVSQF